jgi:hypothetical protein
VAVLPQCFSPLQTRPMKHAPAALHRLPLLQLLFQHAAAAAACYLGCSLLPLLQLFQPAAAVSAAKTKISMVASTLPLSGRTNHHDVAAAPRVNRRLAAWLDCRHDHPCLPLGCNRLASFVSPQLSCAFYTMADLKTLFRLAAAISNVAVPQLCRPSFPLY